MQPMTIAARRDLRIVRGPLRRFDASLAALWLLVGGLVLYLGIEGGGYDLVLRSQVSEVVWWVAVAGAAAGLLPRARPTRAGWAALALFGGFLAWTAIATSWSISTQDSLGELSRDAGYLGVLVLALALHRDRERAIRHTVAAVACSIVVIACLALASRLHPSLFPAAQQTAAFLPGARGRLGWPLNYWNALGALVALGLPLLLALAGSARRLGVQAAAAAAIPLLVLCGYLTFSRGAALASAVAVGAYLALTPERLLKLATLAAAAAGSAALIAGASARHALEHGLTGALATHQGSTLIAPIVLACAGVGAAQLGIGLAARHGTLPRPLRISPTRARWLLAGAVVLAVVIALAAGAPAHIAHVWQQFKQPQAAALRQNSLARFGSASGNGRYAYWKVLLQAATGAHLWRGWGPGTYQLIWLPRAPFASYVVNAHSLPLETLSDTGIVGLTLLGGFFLVAIAAAIRAVTRSGLERRAQAAGAAAALLAFTVSSSFDWFWQVPVLPVSFLVLAAAVLAPRRERPRLAGLTRPAGEARPPTGGAEARPAGGGRARGGRGRLGLRLGVIATGVACLAAIGVALALTEDLRASQAASRAGDLSLALRDARAAVSLEPAAAGSQLQLALVLEQRGELAAAGAAARRATADEPANWSDWLVRSRIEAELGHPRAALLAFRRARSLNPHSTLFEGLAR